MKIIYNASTGVLVSTMGDIQLPAVGEMVAEGNFMEMTKAPRYYMYNGGFVVPRNEDDVLAEIASENFSFETFVGQLFQEMPLARTKALGVQTGTLQWLVTWKNWPGVVEFMKLLVHDGDATQAEADTIKAAFARQGVNLDNYAS